jgi:RNA polymerase sigma-70 factor (ECF subfamily)
MAGTSDDDAILIRAAQMGELDAFNQLVARHQDAAYTTAYRMMGDAAAASDIVQEALITAWRQIAALRGERFRPWLMRIVINRCTDALRRGKRRPTLSLSQEMPGYPDETLPVPDDAPTPEQAAEADELNAAIQRCIDRLPADQRAALVLCDVDGLDYQAIARVVGAGMGTVKSRLSRARAAVRTCLQGVRELLPAVYRLNDQDNGLD